MQQIFCRNHAVIGSVLILFAVILVLREWQWKKVMDAKIVQTEIAERIRLKEPVKITISQCINSDRGMEWRTRIDKCKKSGLDSAELGDEVKIAGKWKHQLITGGLNQKSFIDVDKIDVSKKSSKPIFGWWWWNRMIIKTHDKLVQGWQKVLPEPEATLLAGIVIGEQANFPDELKEALKKTGLMHVVAASGFNVVVVIQVITYMAVKWWGRRWGSVMALIGILIYVGLAGGSPPIVRAGIMGGLSLIGVITGREYWANWSFGLTIWLMLMISPWLIESVSFQLTVAATAGLMLSGKNGKDSPNIDNLSRWERGLLPVIQTIKETWRTTLAAMAATLPLQVIYFGQMSWLGLFVNPLVLWMIPWIMYVGAWQVGLEWIWPMGGQMMSWLSYPLVHIWIGVVVWLSKIPFGYYLVVGNWWMAVGWWMVWVGLVSWSPSKQQ